MRLLNSTTFKLQEFFDTDRPQFAILSHTWEKDEVSYQEMLAPTAATKSKDGFSKIQGFASIAKSHGWDWVWVDTCCIDKASSAELSEAINSMYRWYRDAAVCYVYLSDFKTEHPESLQNCRWFGRGWTLQELIAPRVVRFYSHLWEFVFTKSDMLHELYRITGIDRGVLQRAEPSITSIATRLAWASRRQTTRTEDMAYCLLGLFNINMPLLYGEGPNAFVRLQIEILKAPHDQSIFAWVDPKGCHSTYRGLLARHPRDFQDTDIIHRDKMLARSLYGAPIDTKISVSNLGLRVRFPLLPLREGFDPGTFVAVLKCISFGREVRCGILLKRITQVSGPEVFVRVDPHRLWDATNHFDILSFDPSPFPSPKFYVPLNTVSHTQVPGDHVSNRLAGFFVMQDLDPRWRLVDSGASDSSMEWNAAQNAWIAQFNQQTLPLTHMAFHYRWDRGDSLYDVMVVISWRRGVQEGLQDYRCDINPIPTKTLISDYLKTFEAEQGQDPRWSPELVAQGWGGYKLYCVPEGFNIGNPGNPYIVVRARTRVLEDEVAVAVEVAGKIFYATAVQRRDLEAPI